MSLTKFAVRYRPVTLLLLLAILVTGTLAIFTLSRREDPDLQGRFVQIIALYPGADAQQVEELVADRLERALLELDDIKNVESTSRPGIVVLNADAADRVKDMKKFRDDLRNRIADLRSNLPRGVLSVTVNDRFADTSALIVGVTYPGATDRQREDLAKKVRDRLRRFEDAAEVNIIGAQEERVTLSLSAQRMAQFAVTPAQIGDAIARRNTLPATGGSVALGAARFAIEPTGNLTDVSELERLIVATPNGVPVYLRDLATVTRGYADPSPFRMRVNGEAAAGVSLTMRKGFNISTLGVKAKREIATLQAELPPSAQLTLINDLPRSVEGRIGEFRENLIAGVALIFVVMYLFMGLRSALIVGVMLPITILGTFAGMLLLGRDIQQISIFALIIALGLVVDNSIVVVDNIEKKLSEDMERERAVIEGTDELRVPLLTSNLTTVASFAPILLLSGGVGEFIADLGIVTTVATLVSLLFNYTIAPLICLRFLRGVQEDRPNALRRGFLTAIDALRGGTSTLAARGVRRPWLTVGLAGLSFVGAGALIPKLGFQFFPPPARAQFTIDVWLPEGRDIRATERVAAQTEEIVRAQQGIESFTTYIGQGGPRFYYNVNPEPPAANYAQIVVNTASATQAPQIVQAVQRIANETISDARITVRKLEQGPPVGAPIAVRITGERIDELRRVGEEVKRILNATPGASSAYHNYGELPLALKVDVDQEQAQRLGLTSADIAQATQMGFSGTTVSVLREGDKEIPIQLRLREAERQGAQSLSDLYLPTSAGAVVPLRQVASVRLAPQESRIVRRNHVRTLTAFAFVQGDRLPSQVLADAQRRIAALKLPSGVQIGYGGEQEESLKTLREQLIVMGVSIAANLIIILWEFNAFRAALTIMAAVPLSMTGGVIGLYLMGQPFGFMAILGIISLGGIVTNHAIVLFEYALEEHERGMPIDAALVEAGRKRLRPILLTVLLAIFGILPQAVNGGTLWPPFAWAQIYGLLLSLLLTLVVIPSVYTVLGLRRERRAKVGGQASSVTGEA